MRQTCVFGGSSHPALTDAICERLGRKPDKVELRKFANGETSVEIKTSVRDQDVFIVQSGSSKINDNVMELLIMISACKGGSSKSITAVMPYFPYSRQSKKKSHRGAITARMIANLMHVAGVNHVITIDLHASQMQGFFKCPVDNLVAEPILARWIRMHVKDWQSAVVVSKNPGGTKRVTSLADALKLSFGIVTTDRRRPHMGTSMLNSVILDSFNNDGPAETQPDAETDAEAHIYPNEPANAAPIEHDFALDQAQQVSQEDDTQRTPHRPRRPTRSRAPATTLAPSVANRLVNGETYTPSSPLAQASHPDSPDSSKANSVSGSGRPAGFPALIRVHTAMATTQPPSDEASDAESEDAYTDERARDVITGRLIHGHIVDDDYPSPSISAMSSSVQFQQRRSSDDDPPENMINSYMSTASSYKYDHGIGGSGDATASDDEEEQALQDPELETTITLVGNVRDRPVFIVDDMIDKAGSWIAAAETVVKRGGATKVYCMATHGLFGGDALQELEDCDEIDCIVVTSSFPIPEEKRRGCRKLVVLDVSNLLAEAIRRNHHGESISQLFQCLD